MQTTETTNLSPVEFALALKKLDACQSAMFWSRGLDYETAWQTCQNPSWMFFLINTAGPLDPITNELLICRFARMVVHLNTDPSVLTCIETRESWARGEATDEQRTAARDGVWAASGNGTCGATWDVTWAAAEATEYQSSAAAAAHAIMSSTVWHTVATRAVMSSTERDIAAARDVMSSTIRDTAAARATVRVELEVAQCDIIREMITRPVLG